MSSYCSWWTSSTIIVFGRSSVIICLRDSELGSAICKSIAANQLTISGSVILSCKVLVANKKHEKLAFTTLFLISEFLLQGMFVIAVLVVFLALVMPEMSVGWSFTLAGEHHSLFEVPVPVPQHSTNKLTHSTVTSRWRAKMHLVEFFPVQHSVTGLIRGLWFSPTKQTKKTSCQLLMLQKSLQNTCDAHWCCRNPPTISCLKQWFHLLHVLLSLLLGVALHD